ncbi:MAG: ATP-binding cassette domain-containing protein, partial [Spirochaetia bacterium]|nr:ATP-binding cassette domain-containing protein [Spirochaetia bacterium]
MTGGAQRLLTLHSVTFQRSGNAILKGISCAISKGEHWVILGPNGAGKSTLASIMTTNEWPTSGSVELLGTRPGEIDLRTVKRQIGFFQPAQYREAGVFHPDMTALDVVCTGSDAALAVYHDYENHIVERAR